MGRYSLAAPLLAAIGIYASVVTYQQMMPKRELKAQGVQTFAQIADATLRTLKSGGQYYRVDLTWSDAQGEARSFNNIRLSAAHSKKLIDAYNDIRGRPLEIKYLPERPDVAPLLLEDPDHPEDDFSALAIFVGIAILGLLATAAAYGPRFRYRSAR